ncbi:hypothetical protein EV424DRAFT_1347822 [Suillus variegatus]|nr:hypothetical protein EV424DRAFT_1347822 [Suillus variegatus]
MLLLSQKSPNLYRHYPYHRCPDVLDNSEWLNDKVTSYLLKPPCSTATIATLICWKVMPQNLIFLGIHFIVAKLHANSLLATLNARKQIRNGKQHTPTNDRSMPIVFLQNFEHVPESSTIQQFDAQESPTHQRGNSVQVNVEGETDSDTDDSPV